VPFRAKNIVRKGIFEHEYHQLKVIWMLLLYIKHLETVRFNGRIGHSSCITSNIFLELFF